MLRTRKNRLPMSGQVALQERTEIKTELGDFYLSRPDPDDVYRLQGRIVFVRYDGFKQPNRDDQGTPFFQQYCVVTIIPSCQMSKPVVSREKVTIVGNFSFQPVEAAEIEVTGRFREHRNRGRLEYQLHADVVMQKLPQTAAGIYEYLARGNIKGVGKDSAAKLFRYFGDDLPMAIENRDLMLGCGVIPPAMAEKIHTTWIEMSQGDRAKPFLLSHGIGPAIADRIVQTYKNRTLQIVTENPWRLALEIRGVGFLTADRMAQAMGRSPESPDRVVAGLWHTLNEACESEGHCFVEQNRLIAMTSELLKVDAQKVALMFDQFLHRADVSREALPSRGSLIFPKDLLKAEMVVASKIREMLARPVNMPVSETVLDQLIAEKFVSFGLEADVSQVAAVKTAIMNNVSIVTGGPGTGKSTVMRVVIAVLNDIGINSIVTMGPTGKAARRLEETTGVPSGTMHQRLKLRPGQDAFEEGDGDLNCDVSITDEFSMPDIRLSASLMSAVPQDSRVILVGDEDQIPSIGPGQVLTDLIASGTVPVARLENPHRQAKKSAIVMAAHAIKRGDWNALQETFNALDGSVQFVEIKYAGGEDGRERMDSFALEQIVKAVTETLPKKGIGIHDTTVLSPMRQYRLGSIGINQRLAEIINPRSVDTPVFDTRNFTFAPGDRIIVTENDHLVGVANGEVGNVLDIVTTDTEGRIIRRINNVWGYEGEDRKFELYTGKPQLRMLVSFGTGDPAVIDAAQAENLVQAPVSYRRIALSKGQAASVEYGWAITIHKSQGSEFPGLVMVVANGHMRMLNRNLIYTGLTRGKKQVVIIGSPWAMKKALEKTATNCRNTMLAWRLKHVVPEMTKVAHQTQAAARRRLEF